MFSKSKMLFSQSGKQPGTAADPQAVQVSTRPADTAEASAATGSKDGPAMTCSLCSQEVPSDQFTQHLSDYHVEEQCERCGAKALGAVGLTHHLESCHVSSTHLPNISPPTPLVPPSTFPAQETTQTRSISPQHAQETASDLHPQDAPAPLPVLASACPPAALGPPLPLRSPELGRARFLPKPFYKIIKPGDQEWIAHILYEPNGQLKQDVRQNWHHPPSPSRSAAPPEPHDYFRQKMFLWAPMRMWGIPLKCTQCNRKMHHSGIYPKVREVIDVDTKYYLIGGDYPRCSQCKLPVCPWSSEILKQLDPSKRNKFPAVLTTHLALDRKCVTLLRPRTAGNSSSYLQQAFQEAHSEEWARRSCDYLTDCESHRKSRLSLPQAVYAPPPPFCPLPLAQWFETVHANDVVAHLDELKSVITSTYGRILKLDSTKKVNAHI